MFIVVCTFCGSIHNVEPLRKSCVCGNVITKFSLRKKMPIVAGPALVLQSKNSEGEALTSNRFDFTTITFRKVDKKSRKVVRISREEMEIYMKGKNS